MPILNGHLTSSDGAFIAVRITPTRQDLARRRRSGQVAPQAEEVSALVDTGAEVSCIDRAVANRLGLVPKQYGTMHAPVVGGGTFAPFYEIEFTVPHPTTPVAQFLVIPDLDVAEIDLGGLGYDAVLGRDVLASCVLIYDGVSNSFILTY